MKIAIFTDVFLPNIDGVVTSTLNLAKGLADKGHKIIIICPKFKNHIEFKHKNIKVLRVKSINAFFYKGIKISNLFSLKVYKFLKKENIDIIHFQTPITLGIQAIIISKLLKVPLVGTFHTFFADPEYLKNARLNYKFVEKLAWNYSRKYYNNCDLITCPSLSTKKELIKNNHNKRIKVISNGIDTEMFDNSNYKKVKNKINKNGKILLFVGRIAHGKNIYYLLDCFKMINKKVPTAKLLIVGDGPEFESMKNKVKSLNLENNVIFTGKIKHKRLIKSGIYKASDIFVTASLTENQPMTILEAQVNGLPCIGINARGIPDLIKNNFNGFLIPKENKKEFADKVIKLLNNKKLYNKMKKNTLKNIKKEDIKNIIIIWEKTYLTLIKYK